MLTRRNSTTRQLRALPGKDEPDGRRYEKLVERLESLMRAALKPEYQGYYGQLILSGDDLAEMGELKDVRRAAREAQTSG